MRAGAMGRHHHGAHERGLRLLGRRSLEIGPEDGVLESVLARSDDSAPVEAGIGGHAPVSPCYPGPASEGTAEKDSLLEGTGFEPTVPRAEIAGGTDGLWTLPWRRQSRANPSLRLNSLLAGKIQGIFTARRCEAGERCKRKPPCQGVTRKFPTPPNREFFGINRELDGAIREYVTPIRES
jgi:hypothetical protein